MAGLTPEERQKPCYHPGGIVAAENFIELRLKELAVHEWDVRAALEPAARLSPATFPAILATISESIASGSLRWAFWSGPAPATPVRYRFEIAGPGPPSPISSSTARPCGWRTPEPRRPTRRSTATPRRTSCWSTAVSISTAAIASGRVRVEGDGQLRHAFGQWFRGI